MIEYAYSGRFRKQRSIQDLPEFRDHLEREGITFEQWQLQNQSAGPSDATTDSLRLRIRALKAKFG